MCVTVTVSNFVESLSQVMSPVTVHSSQAEVRFFVFISTSTDTTSMYSCEFRHLKRDLIPVSVPGSAVGLFFAHGKWDDSAMAKGGGTTTRTTTDPGWLLAAESLTVEHATAGAAGPAGPAAGPAGPAGPVGPARPAGHGPGALGNASKLSSIRITLSEQQQALQMAPKLVFVAGVVETITVGCCSYQDKDEIQNNDDDEKNQNDDRNHARPARALSPIVDATVTTETTRTTTTRVQELFAHLQSLYHHYESTKTQREATSEVLFRWSPTMCPKPSVQRKIDHMMRQRRVELDSQARKAAKTLLAQEQQQQQAKKKNKKQQQQQHTSKQQASFTNRPKNHKRPTHVSNDNEGNNQEGGNPLVDTHDTETEEDEEDEHNDEELVKDHHHQYQESQVQLDEQWDATNNKNNMSSSSSSTGALILVEQQQDYMSHDNEWTTIQKGKKMIKYPTRTMEKRVIEPNSIVNKTHDDHDNDDDDDEPKLLLQLQETQPRMPLLSSTDAAGAATIGAAVAMEPSPELDVLSCVSHVRSSQDRRRRRSNIEDASRQDGGIHQEEEKVDEEEVEEARMMVSLSSPSLLLPQRMDIAPIGVGTGDESVTRDKNAAAHEDDDHHHHRCHSLTTPTKSPPLGILPVEEKEDKDTILQWKDKQLAQCQDLLEKERRMSQQALKEEKEASQERLQALQLRLYIAETRLKILEDALQQHVDTVNENLAPQNKHTHHHPFM